MKIALLTIVCFALTGCTLAKPSAVDAVGDSQLRADVHLESAQNQLVEALPLTTGKANFLVGGAKENVGAARGDVADAGRGLKLVSKQLSDLQAKYDALYGSRWSRLGRFLWSVVKWILALVGVGFGLFVVGNLLTGGWAGLATGLGHLSFGFLTAIPWLAQGFAHVIKSIGAAFGGKQDAKEAMLQ